ncbi:MAG: arginyltransferase [Gammaproteobacteria bacterium]|nr:arginyltransferase [Gammaproteobacteria bacterium]MDH5801883.1 arginyltransferase [Gammaproteobacteria bacterium]
MVNLLNLYQSDIHPCSYLADRDAITVFTDPNVPMNTKLYEHLLTLGFRRSGNYIYTPKCPSCSDCISVRVPAAAFCFSRNHKRTLSKNSDLHIIRTPARFNQEQFELYCEYVSARHEGGGMENPSEQEYENFLSSRWCNTGFYEFRQDRQLLAVAVVDELEQSLSAVYTFFKPQQQQRSLGHLAILHIIKMAQQLNKPWVYLGYYISDCDKMRYKSRYQPLQGYQDGRWGTLLRN